MEIYRLSISNFSTMAASQSPLGRGLLQSLRLRSIDTIRLWIWGGIHNAHDVRAFDHKGLRLREDQQAMYEKFMYWHTLWQGKPPCH